VVYAGGAEQRARLAARDRRAPEEIAGILAAQWPLAEKKALAHYVVDNCGSREDTRSQVNDIWRDLENLLDKTGEKS
jgi:dephospho-CoA kinase